MALRWYLMQRFESSYGIVNIYSSYSVILNAQSYLLVAVELVLAVHNTSRYSTPQLEHSHQRGTHTILSINAVEIVYAKVMIVRSVDKFCISV